MSKNKSLIRQSNFELLRIISMLMIISVHFVGHSGFSGVTDITANTVFIKFLAGGGQIGVNIFFLISGYFLINERHFRLSRLIKLWLTLFSYYLIFYIGVSAYKIFILHNFEFSITELLNCLFPIFTNRLWFASTYFALYLFSPFINKLLHSLDQTLYIRMLIIMFVIWSIVPSVTRINFQYTLFLWSVFLYCFAGYIRLYKNDINLNSKKLFLYTSILYLAVFAEKISISLLGSNLKHIRLYFDRLFSGNNVLIFLLSVMIFLSFKSINIKSKLVNTVASTTFGVYIVHENEYARQFLANHIYAKVANDNSLYIPYSIIMIILIFILCSLIELLRKHLLENRYMPLIKMIDSKIHYLTVKTENKVLHNNRL